MITPNNQPGLFFSVRRNMSHLWSQSDVVVPHEARVGVVLDVFSLDVMLQVEERFSRSVYHLHHTHLHDVHLRIKAYFL